MPVTFDSHGYDTTAEKQYLEGDWAAAHPFIGSSAYGVLDAGHWKVTAVAGADRTISIAPGFGWGHGVTDKTTANETIQLAPISTGTRWDTIAVRRDWTPTAGVSQFVKITGSAAKAISGSRLVGPGEIDDQPIALVQVTAGQTQPTGFVDLRCWAGNGGVVARDPAALAYLAKLGAEIKIGSTTWFYGLDNNGLPAWTNNAPDVKSIALAGGYAALGAGILAPTTSRHADGRVFLGGAIGASGAYVDVDKKTPTRFKVGQIDPSHLPAGIEPFRAIATLSMGDVYLYVYPAGHAKAGWLEFEASAAPGKILKEAFSILLTGGLSWAGA